MIKFPQIAGFEKFVVANRQQNDLMDVHKTIISDITIEKERERERERGRAG